MRLATFVHANIEPILEEWEAFARQIWPDPLASAGMDASRVRDHAEAILHATVRDMLSDQTARQQSDKSKGDEITGEASDGLHKASGDHGSSSRVGEGFELWAIVAEYRALRASVLRLWRESGPSPDVRDLEDLTRFNESIDQSLTEAIRSYTDQVDRNRRELQSAHYEAESLNRSKDIFLATLSHELRGPLNAIVGWINILRAEGHTAGHLSEGLDVIERNTRAQVHLIQDVLDVSSIVSGKMRLETRLCDLREPINAGIDAVRAAAKARDIRIDVQLCGPEQSQAWCDPTRFQQVVWNLVSNAVKFTPENGTVLVTLTRDESSSKLTVSDNGKGISPDQLAHVVERFQQADSGTRRKFGGLGLGLSIVKYLVEMHGGTVEAHSDGEDQGATFTVRIPVRATNANDDDDGGTPEELGRDPTADADSFRPPVRLDGLRVLVVDDEPDDRRMMSKVLEGVGASVSVVGSAQDALQAIASSAGGFDVLVSDLGMPEQDGYDLIREIRRRGKDSTALPAIALTGFAHDIDASNALTAGFQRHLPKPVDVHELTSILASLVVRST